MRDPYLIDRPGVVSFSGGRTSGYMLWHILQAYGGKLPDDIKVIFCNTGKERLETLDFVERCAVEWNVEVIWLEYRYSGMEGGEVGSHSFSTVDYQTASRNGEPFTQLIQRFMDYRKSVGKPPVLPNVVQRFCSSEMKVRTNYRYLKSIGWESGWEDAIGIRYDEPQRVVKGRSRAGDYGKMNCYPLYDAKVTESTVMDFWSRQPFDLQLKQFQGNCDLCFLKSNGKISRIIQDNPEAAKWWIEQEDITGQRFRRDRPGYRVQLQMAQEPGLFDQCAIEDDYLSQACHCTD